MNRKSEKTKRLIKDTFVELLKTEPVGEIKVTQICELAGIHRTTFYLHYDNVDEIMNDIFDRIVNEMLCILSDFHYRDFFSNPQKYLARVNEYFQKDFDFYKTLMMTEESDIQLARLRHIFAKKIIEDSDIPESVRLSKRGRIRTEYFAGGIISLYKEYFSGTLDATADDIASEVAELIHDQGNRI